MYLLAGNRTRETGQQAAGGGVTQAAEGGASHCTYTPSVIKRGLENSIAFQPPH